MFGPPALDPADLAHLIEIAGGIEVLRRVLRYVPAHALHSGTPEALALTWYAGPLGRAAAAIDLANELRYVAQWNAVLTEQLEQQRRELRKALNQVHRGTANEPIFSDGRLPSKGGSLGREDRRGAGEAATYAKHRHRSALA